jgi:hypothetical protein
MESLEGTEGQLMALRTSQRHHLIVAIAFAIAVAAALYAGRTHQQETATTSPAAYVAAA